MLQEFKESKKGGEEERRGGGGGGGGEGEGELDEGFEEILSVKGNF